MIGILVGSMLGLLLLSVPVAFALGIGSVLALAQSGSFPTEVVIHRAIAGVGSFPMLALPLFILCGYLMEHGSTMRLMRFANALLGRIPGGLAAAQVSASAMFGAVSGSGIATIAAVGGVFGPEMVRKQYPKGFIVSLLAASGGLGVLIPPSVPLIIFGLIGNVSIGALFFGTIVPGLLVTTLIILTASGVAWMRGIGEREHASRAEIASSFVQALPPLMLPVIILGGIMSGVFTAIESAAIGVVFALILGRFVYKELDAVRLRDALVKSAITSAVVLVILAFSASFAWVVTISQFPVLISSWLTDLSDSPWVIFAVIQLIFLVLGIVLEALPIIIITTPIFLPTAMAVGIDPVVYGIVLTMNIIIAGMSPPVATSIFVAARIVKARPGEANVWLLLFIAPLIVAGALCMAFPEIVLALPRWLNVL